MTNLYAMAVRHSPSARDAGLGLPTPQSTNEQEVDE